MTDTYAYYEQQARLIGAAGVIVCDLAGSILLVKPNYRDVWHLPGGVMDPDESPRQAARREVREELGVDVDVGRLLSVDFKSATSSRPAGIQFLFDGGTLTTKQMREIRPAPDEIAEWRLYPQEEAVGLVEPGGPASRLSNTLTALTCGETLYLEDGQRM